MTTTMASTWWKVGCIYGATSVALGAFGAHGLKARIGDDSARLASWATAAHYQVKQFILFLMAMISNELT